MAKKTTTKTEPTTTTTKKATKKTPAPKSAEPKATNNVPSETKKKGGKAKETREIIYDKIGVQKFEGEKALTAEHMKKLLGWYECDDNPMFKDLYGKKIRCSNNTTNRPFDITLARTYAHEILNRHWKLNGETLIVGEYGSCLAIQHRGVGLILAVQEWEKDRENWSHKWKTEPVMETILVTGIKEDDDTVNTIDTGKPRDLTAVIFRSSYFDKMRTSDRLKCSSYLSAATRWLASRTGEFHGVKGRKLTNADHLDFLNRHSKLVECVKHIWEENGAGKEGDKLTKHYVPEAGRMAALMYLMATCKSDPIQYRESEPRSENDLDFSFWTKAADFWVLLGQHEKSVAVVAKYINQLLDESAELGAGGSMDRIAVVIKAWNLYSVDSTITPKQLEVEYDVNEDGIRILRDYPTVGGIDLGTPQEPEPADTIDTDESREAVDEREREAEESADDQDESADETEEETEFAIGDIVTVNDTNSPEPWTGEIVKTLPRVGKLPPQVLVKDEQGDEYEVYRSWLTST